MAATKDSHANIYAQVYVAAHSAGKAARGAHWVVLIMAAALYPAQEEQPRDFGEAEEDD